MKDSVHSKGFVHRGVDTGNFGSQIVINTLEPDPYNAGCYGLTGLRFEIVTCVALEIPASGIDVDFRCLTLLGASVINCWSG